MAARKRLARRAWAACVRECGGVCEAALDARSVAVLQERKGRASHAGPRKVTQATYQRHATLSRRATQRRWLLASCGPTATTVMAPISISAAR
ncbi:hypothetical protein QF025_006205 [Paraburkholderia graminis]|uniref:Uncharacterized protein n=1 Tax=Paraburkholderia graminis TaxID=60548 RepID=A0ABD5CSG9_9BURK|nr:hypothetical protein [Paraburkholderia graminis]